jgi:hypothetical protein
MSDQLPKVKVSEFRQVENLLQLDEETLDPELHYRWVTEHPLKIARARMKHYEFVHQDTGVKTLAGFIDSREDGIIRIGDVILMACPKGEFVARKKGQRKFAENRLSAPASQFRKQAKKRRVRILREEEED